LNRANGRHDIRIRAAAADIAGHTLADFGVAERFRSAPDFIEKTGGRADLAGRTIPALKSVVFDKGGLQRVKFAVLRQAFDGRDALAIVRQGQAQAGIDAHAAGQHRAGAALAVIAAFLGSGEVKTLAKEVEQGDARIERQSIPLTVDRDRAIDSAGFFRGSLRFRYGNRDRQTAGYGGRAHKLPPGEVVVGGFHTRKMRSAGRP
jgi:hypothetical protein